jgi:ABC-type Fe3+-hydroxamate transport system substrate-binding protein
LAGGAVIFSTNQSKLFNQLICGLRIPLMPAFTDQTGRTISINTIPQRIVSLVPSQTELLADLGLDQEVVGITKFCVHPASWYRSKTRVGGTKQLKMDAIHSLQPDLIIANKEENVKEQVEELAEHYPVWISDVHDLDSAYQMMEGVGNMTGKTAQAKQIIATIQASFAELKPPNHRIRACYLIWKDPYMTVGGDTFIQCMMEKAGFENVFSGKTRYPELEMKELLFANCRLLILSSEPYPFQHKHIDEIQALLPGIKIILVDGEMFSWYGSRLQKAPSYFEEIQRQMIDNN